MPSSFYHLVIDSHDPHALARFWPAVLDQPILFEADGEVIVGAHKKRLPRPVLRDGSPRPRSSRTGCMLWPHNSLID
jgi:hypothetical protein